MITDREIQIGRERERGLILEAEREAELHAYRRRLEMLQEIEAASLRSRRPPAKATVQVIPKAVNQR